MNHRMIIVLLATFLARKTYAEEIIAITDTDMHGATQMMQFLDPKQISTIQKIFATRKPHLEAWLGEFKTRSRGKNHVPEVFHFIKDCNLLA